VTDIAYGPDVNFSEMEFVVPGPGAKDGLRKCFASFGGLSEVDLMKYVADNQEREFAERGLVFRTLWGRPLQLIDCQNLFCEVDKYCRVFHPELSGKSGRSRIKQKFMPSSSEFAPLFPPKWSLSEAIRLYPHGADHLTLGGRQ
jgi:hypothetical protein